jgi:hypothetical protein
MGGWRRSTGLVLPLCMLYSTAISLTVLASFEYALLSHYKVVNLHKLTTGCTAWELSQLGAGRADHCANSDCVLADFYCL